MTAYDAFVPRYDVRAVLHMPGLAQIKFQGDMAILRFETSPGCEPCGVDFLVSELRRMGSEPVVVVAVPGDSTSISSATQ